LLAAETTGGTDHGAKGDWIYMFEDLYFGPGAVYLLIMGRVDETGDIEKSVWMAFDSRYVHQTPEQRGASTPPAACGL